MNEPPRIIVVDDHPEIRRSVARYLERNALQVTTAENTAEMDSALASSSFDLVVLDVMMPGEDGLSACKRLREQNDIPILMLTAKDQDEDLLQGFDAGADDYISKPFNPPELLARIHATLRRATKSDKPKLELDGHKVRFGELVYDVDARIITRDNGRMEILTSGEAKLLCILIENARDVLSRDDLLMRTMGRTAGPFDRTIDNMVSRLRKKIEPDVLRPRIISTIRNGGYSLTSDVQIL
jgi:two-component system OmpR family response regulator